jgi:dynein light intermediate chain 1
MCAITYGASLFYVSSKTKTNLKLFYDYILHRFYSFTLKDKAEVLSRESIFIPSGFDSANIIDQCFPVESYKKHIYEDLIKPNDTKTKQVAREEL